MDRRSENELVVACRDGDKTAYEGLVKRHYRRVFAICLGVLADTHDAEDAAQETFVKGFRRIGKLRAGEQFSPWIGRIAKNLCIDVLRRQQRQRDVLTRQSLRQEPGNRNTHDLQEAIKRLPLELREPLVMYYFDERSAKSIAETLSISHSGVCQRLRNARKELHRLLTEQGDPG